MARVGSFGRRLPDIISSSDGVSSYHPTAHHQIIDAGHQVKRPSIVRVNSHYLVQVEWRIILYRSCVFERYQLQVPVCTPHSSGY